ncbi:hypothetical protein HYS48_01595 [Candidatus Woesearchaeota archaeon]|nr:hypothetical protein [Candidatus Woesearchaeota archaeon]
MGRLKKRRRFRTAASVEIPPVKTYSRKSIIGISIIAIMVLSSAAFIFFSNPNVETDLSYNGFEFSRQQNYYVLQYNEERIPFINHPGTVQQILIEPSTMEKLQNSPQWYLTFNPDMELSALQAMDSIRFDFGFLLPKNKNVYVVEGIAEYSPLYSSLPQITCKNATAYIPVLFFNQSNQSQMSIQQRDNCILIEAQNAFQMLQFRDRVLYNMFGVISS